jgi:pyridinium-3,5-biscarboxylic acid mononucleotide synthase
MTVPHDELSRLLAGWTTGSWSLDDLDQVLSQHYRTTAAVDDVLVDLDRVRRCGLPEVVYGAGKSTTQILAVLTAQREAGQPSLVTRCEPQHLEEVPAVFPEVVINHTARTLRRGVVAAAGNPRVIVVTAGATDRPVAEEAMETAVWAGCSVQLLTDVGVAGPWRLIERRDELQDADAIVVVAGMEGALPSVVAGWVRCPVIGVPTSVGYGANFGGMSALLSMLNSCAAHVAVVNIDGGFKGGYLAATIARQTAAAR